MEREGPPALGTGVIIASSQSFGISPVAKDRLKRSARDGLKRSARDKLKRSARDRLKRSARDGASSTAASLSAAVVAVAVVNYLLSRWPLAN